MPESPDAPPAASSAVADVAPLSGSAALASLTGAQRHEWERTGTLPNHLQLPPDADAASSAEKPVDQAASTEVVPAAGSDPAKKKGLEPRKAELDGEIAELHERLKLRKALREELKLLEAPPAQETKQPASSAAPADVEPDPADATKYPDGQFDLKFIKDQARFEARQELKAFEAKTQAQQQTTQAQQAIQATVSQYQAQITAAKTADPQFLEKVSPEVQALVPREAVPQGQAVTPLHDVASVLIASPVAPALMLHLSDHPEVLRELAQLPMRSAVLLKMGELSALVKGPAAKAAEPAPKTLTSAPDPVTTVGSKTADTVDPVVAALKTRNFSAYMREQNAREMGAGKR